MSLASVAADRIRCIHGNIGHRAYESVSAAQRATVAPDTWPDKPHIGLASPLPSQTQPSHSLDTRISKSLPPMATLQSVKHWRAPQSSEEAVSQPNVNSSCKANGRAARGRLACLPLLAALHQRDRSCGEPMTAPTATGAEECATGTPACGATAVTAAELPAGCGAAGGIVDTSSSSPRS